MHVIIANEDLWRKRGRGNRLDVLRAFVADKDDYMDSLVEYMERYEKRTFIDPVVLVEYEEPDEEFSKSGVLHFLGAIVESLDIPAEFNTFCEVTGDRVDFVIDADFTDTSHAEYFTGRATYCPVSFSLKTLQRMPKPPDRFGIVIELVAARAMQRIQ